MNISRRSFLKMAGLTVVAAAGASMFTGCGLFSTTPITVVAAEGSTDEFKAAVEKLNKDKPFVYPANLNGDLLKGYLPGHLATKGLKDFEVVKYEYKTKKDANGKDYNCLEVTVKSTK